MYPGIPWRAAIPALFFQWIMKIFIQNRNLAKVELLPVESKHCWTSRENEPALEVISEKQHQLLCATSRCCLKKKFKNQTEKPWPKPPQLLGWTTLSLKQILSNGNDNVRNKEVVPCGSFDFCSASLRLPSCKYLCQKSALFSWNSFPKTLLQRDQKVTFPKKTSFFLLCQL